MAEELASGLATQLPVDVRIVSSPSRRATATAAAIARRLDALVEIDPAWREVDVGLAEGLTFDQIAERFPGLAADLAIGSASIDWPGGETAAALDERIAGALAAVTAGDRPTVVVSHAGAIRVAIAIASGRRPDEVPFPTVASWNRYEVSPALPATT